MDIATIIWNIGIGLTLLGSSVVFAIKTQVWKKQIEKQMPTPPSDETLAQADQALRQKISLQVGVEFGAQLDAAKKRIQKLEDDNAELKLSLEGFQVKMEAKDEKIDLLNGQVSRLERQHEKEETKREQAEEKYHKAEVDKMELATELKVYRSALGLIQESLARPVNITLALDGVIIREVKADLPVAILPEGEIKKEDSNPS